MPVEPVYNNMETYPVETPENVARLVDMLVPVADGDEEYGGNYGAVDCHLVTCNANGWN
jgi:hypothetical protein